MDHIQRREPATMSWGAKNDGESPLLIDQTDSFQTGEAVRATSTSHSLV
ncbi:hypothetical protein [Paenibacillus polysaccharolyticus]|nr:hypothetical protein [Paenibacillus polysaccharolyticus]